MRVRAGLSLRLPGRKCPFILSDALTGGTIQWQCSPVVMHWVELLWVVATGFSPGREYIGGGSRDKLQIGPQNLDTWDTKKVEQRSMKLQENESVQTTLNFMKVASFCFEPSRRGKVASFASSKLFMIVFFFSAKFTDMNLCNWLSVFDPISTMINFVLRHAVPKSFTPHDPTNGRGKLRLWSRRCRQTV